MQQTLSSNNSESDCLLPPGQIAFICALSSALTPSQHLNSLSHINRNVRGRKSPNTCVCWTITTTADSSRLNMSKCCCLLYFATNFPPSLPPLITDLCSTIKPQAGKETLGVAEEWIKWCCVMWVNSKASREGNQAHRNLVCLTKAWVLSFILSS